MDLHIDTLYLELDYSQYARLQYIPNLHEYKTNYFIRNFKHKTNTIKSYTFEYSIQYFKLDGYWFKVSCYKLGRYRLELIGLHQYHKDNTLKDNTMLKSLYPIIKHSNIIRLDLCKDSRAKPHQKKLITSKTKYCGTTLYHNLYSKNYFSSYVYDKQAKNKLELPIWRTEYSFKRILQNSNKWRYQFRHISKLVRNCERFIDKLEDRAEKIRAK